MEHEDGSNHSPKHGGLSRWVERMPDGATWANVAPTAAKPDRVPPANGSFYATQAHVKKHFPGNDVAMEALVGYYAVVHAAQRLKGEHAKYPPPGCW